MVTGNRGRWIWTALLGAMVALPGQADSPKVSRDLHEALSAQGEQRVIVTYTAEAPASKKSPRRVGHVLQGIDAVSDRLTGAEIAALAGDPPSSPSRPTVGSWARWTRR